MGDKNPTNFSVSGVAHSPSSRAFMPAKQAIPPYFFVTCGVLHGLLYGVPY